jgi:hypothetical protein
MTPLAAASADEELLRQVLAETRVATRPAGPTLLAYVSDVMEALFRRLGAFFASQPEVVRGILGTAVVIALAVVVAALLLLALAAFRRLRGRADRGPSVPHLVWSEKPGDRIPAHDRAAFRAEIEACLARGDIAGALQALWWFLATSLGMDSPIDPSWTTRELLQRAGRAELLRLAPLLDALRYGRRTASRKDVADGLQRVEEALA